MTGDILEEPKEPFDPYAYAQRWYEEHPEVLRKYIIAIHIKEGRYQDNDQS